MWTTYMLSGRQGNQENYDNVDLRLDCSNVRGYPVDANLLARNLLDDSWMAGAIKEVPKNIMATS